MYTTSLDAPEDTSQNQTPTIKQSGALRKQFRLKKPRFWLLQASELPISRHPIGLLLLAALRVRFVLINQPSSKACLGVTRKPVNLNCSASAPSRQICAIRASLLAPGKWSASSRPCASAL